MAKHCDFCFRVAIFLTFVVYLVEGGCDDTALGLESSTVPDNKLTASTEFNNTTPAENGRLNYVAGSSWCASSSDPTPYFQVDLGSVYIICAVATQGNSQADQWVRTYQVQYSTDGVTWLDYKESGNTRTFQANYDRSTMVKRFLFEGVQAQYIRVIPKSDYNRVCLRLELYGVTKTACSNSAVGVDVSAIIPNYRFTASSYFNGNYKPFKARLKANLGWTTTPDGRSNAWLKIDLGNAITICSLVTKGNSAHNEFIKEYKLRLSMDNVTWQYYQENGSDKVFVGNTNPSTEVLNGLNQATLAKFIEVWPTAYNLYPTLRMEMYGVPQGCRSSLGVEKGTIADSKLTGSSGVATSGRLYNAASAWCTNTLSNNEYIQVELNELATVTGIAAQGHPTLMQWTKTFTIKYSYNNKDWFDFRDGTSSVKIFTAADGNRKGKTSWFRYPIVARYVRIHPQTWQQKPCLRFDLYGCNSVIAPQVSVTGTASISSDNNNANVALECRARGQPIPDVKWKIGENDITNQAQFVTQADGLSLSRLISSVRMSQFPFPNTVCVKQSGREIKCPLQNYTCAASYLPINGGGMKVSQTSLTINLNAPAAATNLRLLKVEARSVTISWDTPDPGHTPITSYKLQIGRNQSFITNETLNSRQVSGLTPYQDYALSFKVTAISKLGEGLTAQQTIPFKTKQAAPSEPRAGQWSVSRSIPRVTVHWVRPFSTNGVIKLYTLYYRYLPDGKVIKVTINDPNVREKTVDVIGGFTYIFEISATTVEEGPKRKITWAAPEYAPQAAPSDFKFRHVDASTFNCSWTPPPREKSHGTIQSYDVSYQTKVAGRRKRAVATINTKTPYALLPGLTVCYVYEVSVRAITVGPGPYSAMVPIANAAIPPSNLKVTDIGKRRVTIEWEKPSMVGSIQGYKVRYDKVQLKGRKAYDKSFQDDRVIDHEGLQKTIDALFPATDYEFQVATKAGCPELTYSDIVRATTVIDNPVRPNITKIQYDTLPGTAAAITLSRSSSQNGPISLYQVIVLIADKDNQMLPKNFEKKLKNFAEAKKANINFYIALEIPAENVTTNSKFLVGDEKTYGQYFNAKLGRGGTYIIFVRAMSKLNGEVFPGQYSKVAEVTVTKGKDPSQTRAGSSSTVIAGVVSAFIVIVLVMVIVFIIYRRRNRSTETKAKETEPMTLQGLALQPNGNGGSYSNLIAEEHIGEDRRSPVTAIASYPKLPLKEGSTRYENVQIEKAPLTVSASEGENELYSNALEESHHKPIPVVQFSEYMNRVKGGNYARLRKEYNELPKSKQFPWTVAEKPENKKLNRFTNIMAYDHSRVNVEPAGGVKYINANYIDGWDGTPKVYIATQGPNPTTVPIFWLMVWKERVDSIVMVTNIVEKGKTKCHQYWPENNAEYGSIKVSLHKVEAFANFTIRTFILNKDSQTRTILQFHFTVWPDHGVPRLPTNILSLRRRVKAQTPKETGPVLVHCSAGVGRTGTYIVVDAMLERAKKQKNVDIYNYIHVVRKGRIHMVQTEDQYIFLHKAVLEALTCGNTEINPNNIRSSLKNYALPSGTQGKTGYALEFERLSFVCPNPGREECETALKQVNIKKNRFPELTPLDISRVLLLRPVLKDGDDYINASFADAYKERNTFILTQAPMQNTIEDFWQMVFDYSIGSVVMLNSLKEEGSTYPKYWPEAETKGKSYGDIKVELLSQENLGEIVFRKLTVEDKKLNRQPQTVHHLQHTAWPNHSVPRNKQSVLDLVTKVTSALQQSRNTSFVVQCSNGVGRSGTFCSIYSTLERIKLEQIVDVFQACKVVRARRPAAVETVEQYEFCYLMVQEFLDSFSNYSNFDDI